MIQTMDIGNIIRSCLIISFLILTGQESYTQNKISLSVGTEYRITPIYLEPDDIYITNIQPTTRNDAQLSGSTLSYSIAYTFHKKKMELSFKHSIRYDMLVYDNSNNDNGNLNEATHALISDYNISLERKFMLKDDLTFNIRMGYSLMNRGTEYTYVQVLNESIYYSSDQDLYFNAISFDFGIERKNLTGYLGIYYAGNHNFKDINPDIGFLIPTIQLQYKLFDF